jgi:CRP-like cAMP-binding protein
MMNSWPEKEHFMNLPNQPEATDTGARLKEISNFLRRLPVFRKTPVDVLKLYAYLAKKEQYTRGDTIIEQGQPSDRMYLIMKGEVSLCEERNKQHFFLQNLTEKEFNYFGELALLAKFDWFFSARAVTDVTLLSISREAFIKIHERFPDQYPLAVERIVRLRVDRFVHQIDYLLDHLPRESWKKCTMTIDPK